MSEQGSNESRPGEPGDSSDSGVWRASGAGERIIGLWPFASPPDGFAGDVIDAAVGVARSRDRRRLTRPMVAGAIAVVVAAVVLIALVVGNGRAELDAGARIAERRETLRIGDRSVAVAEAGAVLAWQVADGIATVEQTRGSVFYRVDRSHVRFAVVTPVGRATVLGTCFQVDVVEHAMTVAVYEGAVTVESERGGVRVSPGERAVLAPERSPVVVPIATVADEQVPPAPPGATPGELLAREQAYRSQIEALRHRVAELEGVQAARSGATEPGQPPKDKHDGFTSEELAWMARHCEIRYDIPGYAYQVGFVVSPATAARLGVSDAEREVIDRINREGDPALIEQTKDLYAELTGDRAVADTLEPRTLQHEILLKSRRDDEDRAVQRLSAERAGLARAPSNLSGLPPVERLLRLLVVSGDQYEARLAAVLGARRAAELRHLHAGMGQRGASGCPGH